MTETQNRPTVLKFDALDSTNEEAQRRLAAGETGPLWIVAAEQTAGRGRGGRRWQSPRGNLYASLLLRLDVPPSTATQLSFVAALAVFDTAAAFLPPEGRADLRIKWPNDVLLGGAKLAGILIESMSPPSSRGLGVIIGNGINVSEAPVDQGRLATSLGLSRVACGDVFDALAENFALWLRKWDAGREFASIREAWLERALALDEPIGVNLNGSSIQGTFRGVDHTGALQLETERGVVITVNSGDIDSAARL